MGQVQPQLEKLWELERKLKKEQQRFAQQHIVLEQELRSRNDGGMARRRAHDAHRRICNDNGGDHPPFFARASQNVAAVTILHQMMLEPSTLEGRQGHGELRALLECATV
jgi:hypothetical protein